MKSILPQVVVMAAVLAPLLPRAEGDPCAPIWGGVVGNPGASGIVFSMFGYDDGSGFGLYAGGYYDHIGGQAIDTLAKWNGSQWSPIIGASGSRVLNAVRDYVVFDDGTGSALYAAAGFDVNGEVKGSVVKWDGVEWTLVGASSRSVITLEVFDDGMGPALYAGGSFERMNGQIVNYIAKWDGLAWSDVGGGVSRGALTPVIALEVFDDGTGEALYVGGWYTHAGGVLSNSIAKWDGITWTPLGTSVSGVAGYVQALQGWDDGTGPALHVGGNFTFAGGLSANNMAKWDGQVWSPLGSGTNSVVQALEPFDDGSGPALFAGGYFGAAGGQQSLRIAKWDGSQWHAIDSPLNYEVYDFEVADLGDGPTLYISGQFTLAGGAPGDRITAYRGCINGDFDLDRDVDMSDFVMFMQCYNGSLRPPAVSCPPGVDADLDDDGDVDLGDFATFSLNFTGPL